MDSVLGTATEPLGRRLVRAGLLTESALYGLLLTQQASGGRLGELLVAAGHANYREVYTEVAALHRLAFVDLLAEPPEPMHLCVEDLQDYLYYRVIPWRLSEGKILLATSEPGAAVRAWAKMRYKNACEWVVTSPFDIRRTIERFMADALDARCRNLLAEIMPERSARQTFDNDQKLGIALLFALVSYGAISAPEVALGAFLLSMHGLYLATMIFKAMLFSAGRRHGRPEQAPALPERALPVYTIIVPLYKEAESIPRLVKALKSIDYPAAKLDIKLVLEGDDPDTLAAIKAQKPPFSFEILSVPPSLPRTKPKACNYALAFARGKYVTVYDAEDQPEPQQLRKAASLFAASPPEVACLQARLGYYNESENLLTRWFALEYRILFNRLLPGLSHLEIPLPLGGTSNHFAVERLRALGAWDPYNVTEDADLGIRLAALGAKTRMLDSVTMEEAPLALSAWLKQRARWIKGYMQTWLVHMRKPLRQWRALGTPGFMGMQFFIAVSTLTFLTAPLVWAATLWLLYTENPAAALLPAWFPTLAMLNLLLYLLLHWQQAFFAGYHEGQQGWRADLARITFPLYWCLHSLASYRALWQLLTRPHFWDKTTHGLTKMASSSRNGGIGVDKEESLS